MSRGRSGFRLLPAAARALVGFLLALGFWLAFSAPYERLLAGTAEGLLRATERPAITRLSARGGEILVERGDMAPGAPRPGLPAADIHFNFVLLAALFSLDPRPWRSGNIGAFLAATAVLFGLHAVALVVQARAVYASELGAWSAANYGAAARAFWKGGFHFYLIAVRFAAPFAIWWLFRKEEQENRGPGARRSKKRKARADG